MSSQIQCVVHKFGGTSLASADRYRHVAQLIGARPEPRRIVVVSAMSGVTNTLVRAVEQAGARDMQYRTELKGLEQRTIAAIDELVPGAAGEALRATVRQDVEDIADILHAATLLRSYSADTLDLVSGYGELWSARIMTAHLHATGEAAEWLDARDVLIVSRQAAAIPDVLWAQSREKLEAWLEARPDLPATVIVTGYVASTTQGTATTLGRNGSDFSASIFAALFNAVEIHIWTDVDGVMSANPRLVPDAVLLDSLSYDEAMELAYFGARVIHPSTMAPAVERSVPIFIRNTFNPELQGTRIHLHGSDRFAVKGLATVEDVALLNVEGTGMIGVPGTAHRLFGALRDAGISVVMISQGSSEHSICFAVPGSTAEHARAAVERAFFAERHHGQIQTIDVVRNCSILAIVGDGMAGTPGIAAKFFNALGAASVNVRAIAQGSSERNISVVVDATDTQRALRAVHAGFYLSKHTLSVGIVGAGRVGSTLIRQLADQSERLKQQFDIDVRVRAVATSRRMLLADRQVDLAGWTDQFERDGEPLDAARMTDHIDADHLPHSVMIDCTASEDVALRYGDWMQRGIHVITPNKRANTGELEYYRMLRGSNHTLGAHYLYETTVGAGLPIVQTLRDLIRTGDDVWSIEGIFSGTLSYLFNSYDGTRPFSAIVAEALSLGYTEPDPRDDLSGTDVGRKVVILGREMGLPLDLEHVDVQSLVPDTLREGSVTAFLESLPAHDEKMAEQHEAARRDGNVLRFVGAIHRDGSAEARLRAYPQTHAFARIQLTDNIVQFRTRRYDENPLIVQGPGAGPEVTAAGVFADLLRIAAYLGAPV
ncbi:MAG: bifunctional aspartate kinase/homoserine dehydrogenase I [Gemmatimonadota bacterium]